MDYFAKSIEDCLKAFSSSKQGLSFEEAKLREQELKSQQISVAKKSGLFKKFVAQFCDLMILILLAAAAVSFIIGIVQHTSSEIIDGAVILAIVLMNAVMGMLQENKAEKSLQALEKMTKPEAVLLRSGKQIKIKAEMIVPGDIVVLEAGSIVPADCRLIESSNLLLDEASLTGESQPVEKQAGYICKPNLPISERKNMVYNGTTVVRGRGLAIAVGVGKNSELGKIADVIATSKKEMTPLQKGIKDLGKVITFLVLGMAVITFILELCSHYSPMDAFLTAIAISVAAIPESMPAVITIIMSLGISRLAKQKAIVKHMHSVETLGCCDVICSDKTGTITQNKMQVKAIYCDNKLSYTKSNVGKDFSTMLACMALCNDVGVGKNGFTGDPTEIALAEFAKKYNFDKVVLSSSCKRLNEKPFDSNRKLMSTVNMYQGRKVVFVKGAVDFLLDKCDKMIVSGIEIALTPQRRQEIEKVNMTMASKALRVIGFAVKYVEEEQNYKEENLIFLGLAGMIDPPRKEVKDAVKKCLRAGMRPIMITGDHMETAFAVAKEVGIVSKKSQILTGGEIDAMSDEVFLKKLESVNVFARVSPENKVRIVEGLKTLGHVVAMTGDGVNDAASMKKANIGIGMGITGTDVTKEVADLIITDDNFATIVVAVEEGRKVYTNIQKTVKFLFSANMGEILALFLATIIFPQHVFLLPIQILFVNLITDSLPAIALGVEPAEKGIMESKPRGKNKGLFSDGNAFMTIAMGIVQTLLTLSSFCIGLFIYGQASAMSMAFYTLNIVQFFYLISIRTEKSIFKSNPFANKYCNFAILFAAGLLALIALTPLHTVLKLAPLNGYEWLWILLVSIVMLFASELCKWIVRIKKKKQA